MLVCRPIKPEKAQTRILDFFSLVELYAVKIVSLIVFLVFLYVAARYEITHLLAK
jgi:hypothetical protein